VRGAEKEEDDKNFAGKCEGVGPPRNATRGKQRNDGAKPAGTERTETRVTLNVGGYNRAGKPVAAQTGCKQKEKVRPEKRRNQKTANDY